VWRICRKPLIQTGKYRIQNIALTPPSNSWWIHNIEFGEKETIICSSTQ
jgi:hypothetical protein